MNWLRAPEERAATYSLENPSTPIAKALMFLGGERTITGRAMNDGRALSLPAVFSAVSSIAGDIATQPLKVYQRRADGGRDTVDHPLNYLLNFEVSEGVSAITTRESAQAHVLLRGNAYLEITWNGSTVGSLTLHHPDSVYHIEGTEFYKIVSENRMVHMSNMLHLAGPGGDGVTGFSVIKLARENWSLYSALEESNTRFIANASRPSGVITSPSPITAETANRLKEMWANRNAGLDGVGKTPILDNGMTWQQVGLSAEDTQFIESRQFAVTDIARWFNIPPHKIGDLSRSTFSNIEEQSIEYVRGTLRPWVVRHEAQMAIKLLTPRERAAGLFLKYNMDALLRGDIQRRTEAYATQFNLGALTVNEVRALEDRNPIDGGDRAFIRLDMVPLENIDEVQTPDAVDDERTEQRIEYRAPDDRIQLRTTFLSLFNDAAGRMVRGEVRNVRRLLRTAEDIQEALETYYFDDHPDFAMRTMGPIFRAYAQSVATTAANEVDTDVQIDAEAFADAYAEGFVARYSARSRRDLSGRDTDGIETRTQEWLDGTATANPRAEQVSSQERVKLSDAVARQVFVAAGVGSLIWRTIGDNCPYCRRLNGKRVGTNRSFLLAGEPLEGEGNAPPIIPKNNIRHAPAHKGCDCTIVPGVL
jgi:HK97 family phage portal protein